MILGPSRRYSHARAAVALVTITTFLASMLPPLPAHAAPSAFPAIQQGTGGPPTLGGPAPQASSAEALATVDLATGAAKSSFAFQLPTARGVAQPSLSLVYSSSSGPGFAGVGWTLDLPSIERRGASGMPRYDDQVLGGAVSQKNPSDLWDKYVFAGTPLVPICTVSDGGGCVDKDLIGETLPVDMAGWTYFRAEIDDGMRFFFAPSRLTWQVQTKQGVTMTFGVPSDAAVGGASPVEANHEPLSPVAVYRWNLSRQFDASGNGVYYMWGERQEAPQSGVDATQSQGLEYLTDIYDTLGAGVDTSGNAQGAFAHHVHLSWSIPDGQEPTLALSPSWRTPPALHLEHVDVTSSPMQAGTRELVRRYWLDYGNGSDPVAYTKTFLTGVRLEGTCNHQAEDPKTGLLPAKTGCPEQTVLSMTYTQAPAAAPAGGVPSKGAWGLNAPGPYLLVDANGDAMPELLTASDVSVMHTGSLKATASDLFPNPNTPRFVLGDWIGDGQVNWLWFVNPMLPNSFPTSIPYEIYSNSSGTMVPGGPSNDGSNSSGSYILVNDEGKESYHDPQDDFQTARAMDVDGDGLTDMAFVPAQYTTESVFTYLTAKDISGQIYPLERRTSPDTSPICLNKLMWGGFYSHATQRVVTDYDGDGLADIVVLENVTPYKSGDSVFGEAVAHVFKNRGDGRFGSADASAPACAHGAWAPYDVDYFTGGGIDDQTFTSAGTSMHDIDGDGIADMVWLDSNGLHVVLTNWNAKLGSFEGDDAPQFNESTSDLGCKVNDPQGHNYNQTEVSLQFADVNASGVDDIVALACGYANWFDLAQGVRPGLLETVSNGAGVETTLEYERLSDGLVHPANVPVPGRVVKSVSTTNNLSGPYAQSTTQSYQYDGPVYDARDRAFLGFQTVTTTQAGDANAPGLDTTVHFATGTCAVKPGQGCAPTADYGWRMQRGLPVVIEQKSDADGSMLTTTVDTYTYGTVYGGTDGRSVRQVYLSQTDQYLWPPASNGQQGGVQQTPTVLVSDGADHAYDFSLAVTIPSRTAGHLKRQFHQTLQGNEDWTIDYGLVSRPSATQPADQPILTSTNWKTPPGDPTGWNWRPTVSLVSSTDASGNPVAPVREVDFAYDGSGRLLTVSAPLQGTLPLERSNPGGQTAPTPSDASHDTPQGQPLLLASLSYDTYGNVKQVVRAGGACTGVKFDTAFAQLPTEIDQYTGGCSGDALMTSRSYDRGFEAVTMEVSPSGAESTATYDAFGRLSAAYAPDPSAPMSYDANPVVQYDYSLFDGHAPLRKVKVTTLVGDAPLAKGKGTGPQYSTSFTFFDGFGRPLVSLAESETAHRWVLSGAHQIGSSSGRVLTAWRPLFVSLTDPTQYDVTQTPDPSSFPPSSFQYDALGRITQSTDERNRVTKLSYDPSSLAVTVKDAEQLSGSHQNASSTVVYDGHGRAVQAVATLANKPTIDTITTTYSYLPTGEVTQIQKTHAGGSESYTRIMGYDSLGRRVRAYEPNSSDVVFHQIGRRPISTAYEWRYAYNDAGELVGTSDARGCGENIQYDALGRVLGEDYSPCDPSQPAYSSALESSYVYDAPEIQLSTTPAIFFRGHLTAAYDRAQHSRFFLDGRGRITVVDRQIAAPEQAGGSYTPHFFHRAFGYDEADRVVSATTGADVAALAPGGSYAVTTRYGLRGGVIGVTWGGGGANPLAGRSLLDARTFFADNQPDTSTYGDASHLTESFQPWPDGSLKELKTSRRDGPWVAKTATYTPPDAKDPRAFGDLQDLFVDYDGANNPRTIEDKSSAPWPSGSKPVARTLAYDDLYRLTSMTAQYGAGTDGFVSPYLAESKAGDGTFPALAPLPQSPTRAASQTFLYDFLDNVSASDDDLHVSPDRSFGTPTYGPAGTFDGTPNRLLSAVQGGASIALSYDASGNTTGVTVTRTAPCGGPCVTHYEYDWDEVGRLRQAVRSEGDTAQSTSARVTFGYLYDASGARVVRAELDDAAPGGSSTLTYDVNVFPSLRLQAHTLDGNGDYERSPEGEVLYLQDGAGQTYARTLYQAGLPSPSGSALHVLFELGDHLGSNVAVVDQDTGELVERSSYLSYGAIDSDLRIDLWNDFRSDDKYTGHEDDAEVGLQYFGARYYLPMLARWASPDPLSIHALGGQLNPYGFVEASPFAKVDPFGFDDCDKSGPYCGGGAGAGSLFGAAGALFGGVSGFINNYSTGNVTATGHGGRPAFVPPLTLAPWSAAGSVAFTSFPAGAFGAGGHSSSPLFGGPGWQIAAGVGAVVVIGGLIVATAYAPELFTKVDTEVAPALFAAISRAASTFNEIALAQQGILVPATATATVGGAVAGSPVAKEVVLDTSTALSELFEQQAAEALPTVATPYGAATQELTAEAQAVLADAQNGGTLYRQGSFGVQQTTEAQFWSPSNPAATPGYAGQMGMPGGAAAPDWIMGGTLRSGGAAVTRAAPGLGANAGGAIEVVTPPGGVSGFWFHMPD